MTALVRVFAIVVLAAIATWTASLSAGPRKVIVLPLDGNADAAQRAKAVAAIVKLARGNGGNVTTGNTTFAETAAAVGCDPATPQCADNVLNALAVDEVLYGTATATGGKTTIVVKRAVKGEPPREHTATIQASDSADKVDTALRPVFSSAPGGSGSAVGSAAVPVVAVGSAADDPGFFDTRERKLGVGLAIGGGAALLIGFALWGSESSLQDQINAAPASSAKDLAALRSLEDRASAEAWEGNLLVVLGLAAGGLGAYYLWTDHKARAVATIAPAEHGGGATLVIGGRW